MKARGAKQGIRPTVLESEALQCDIIYIFSLFLVQ